MRLRRGAAVFGLLRRLRGLASQSLPSVCRGLRGVAAKVPTTPQKTAWMVAVFLNGSLVGPITTTSATWAPLPGTAPVEVPSTLRKPTREHGGLASFSSNPHSPFMAIVLESPEHQEPAQASTGTISPDLAWEATGKQQPGG